MNKFIDLNRLEFVITKTCSGNCRHCSNGEVKNNEYISAEAAVHAVEESAKLFSIDSVMTFGGEPLLYADTVCKIHEAACKNNIQKRDIITNGYFSKNAELIEKTAKKIGKSPVTKIFLSADAFHQETIPIEPVLYFAKKLKEYGFEDVMVHPAWLAGENDTNPYNTETKRILTLFEKMGIERSEGNIIFPAGSAVKYLSEYFKKPDKNELFLPCGTLPYTGRIDEIKSLGINSNGDVMCCSIPVGNVYKNNLKEIIENYNPLENEYTKMIIDGGVKKLYDHVVEQGIEINADDCYSSCMLCHKIIDTIREHGFL